MLSYESSSPYLLFDRFSAQGETPGRGSKYFLNRRVETLRAVLHNLGAFTSPVSEAVARGEDSWP